MTSYKCYKCKRSNDVEFIEMYICFICRNIICCNCSHYHNIINNVQTDTLKTIIENKQQLFITSCDTVINFTRFNDIEYIIYNRTVFDDIREIRRHYLMIEWNERH